MVRSFFYILLVGANSIRALKLGPIQGKIKVLRDTRVRTESVDASHIQPPHEVHWICVHRATWLLDVQQNVQNYKKTKASLLAEVSFALAMNRGQMECMCGDLSR